MAEDSENRAIPPPHGGPIEVQHADGRIEHPGVRREATDISYPLVAVSIVVLGFVLAGVGLAARWLFHMENRRANGSISTADELAVKSPIQPRLEPFEPQFPTADSFAVEFQAMEARLQSYGPTDDADFVHVPIEKAIEHVARQMQNQPMVVRDAKSRGLINAGDANSGRVLRGGSP